jgi:hypothetical protein
MAESTEQQRKKVENELSRLDREVNAMDAKLRAYLADRQNKPHPRHHELVEKIQRYRIPPAISTKHLETQLDNLQWKVFYHKKAWQQLWENAEAAYRQGRAFGSTAPRETPEAAEAGKSAQSALHSYYELQQKKLNELGVGSQESEAEFEKRIKRRYQELSRNKGDDQDIVLTFDKEKKKCTLELKWKG